MAIKIEQSAYFEGRRISESDMGGLIDVLGDAGVQINPKDCEKSIEYGYLRSTRKSTVPLLLDLGNHARATSYTLRNEQLEIQLENHSQILGSGITGMMGSRVGSSGILCEVKFEGHSGGEKIVGDALKVLNDLYGWPKSIQDLKSS